MMTSHMNDRCRHAAGRTIRGRGLALLGSLLLSLGLAQAATPSTAEHGQHAPKPAIKAKAAKPALGFGAAVAPDGQLWIVALDAQGQLYTQTSTDAGQTWQPPRTLPQADAGISADGENRPKIAFDPTDSAGEGPRGQVVISYVRPMRRPYSGEVRLLRSTDGGQTFAAPITVHQDRQEITHRFESIGFDAQGRLHVAWIDKRDQEAARQAGQPYLGAAIYRNVSQDGGASFGPDLKVAEHSCECCRLALSPTPQGGMALLWRHVFAGPDGAQVRDHAFARLDAAHAAGPSAPTRATEDGWQIQACPHHGPGLAAAQDGGFHAVWFGVKDGEPAVRYGQLAHNGRPQGPVRALPDPAAEHADVISAGRQVVITWRSFDGEQTRWRAWASWDEGASFELLELGRSPHENAHPRLARHGDRIYALWRDTQGLRVQAIPAQAPHGITTPRSAP